MSGSISTKPHDILSDEERKKLENLELVIKSGIRSFITVGVALSSVRDQRLYRDNYDSFEQYVWGKWQLSRSHGYRLITAAAIIDQARKMSPMGDKLKLPNSERAVRCLSKLPTAQHGAILAKANELAGDGQVTEAHMRDAIERLGIQKVMTLQPKPTDLPEGWLIKLERFVNENGLPEAAKLLHELRNLLRQAKHKENPGIATVKTN
jgi:hypothetical protein